MAEKFEILEEIKRGAFEKSQGIEHGEKFFELIRFLYKLNEHARKDGLLAVAETEIPLEIALSEEIREARRFFIYSRATVCCHLSKHPICYNDNKLKTLTGIDESEVKNEQEFL